MYSRRCSSVPHSSSVGTSMCVPWVGRRCGTPARSSSWRITVSAMHVGLGARAAVGARDGAVEEAGRRCARLRQAIACSRPRARAAVASRRASGQLSSAQNVAHLGAAAPRTRRSPNSEVPSLTSPPSAAKRSRCSSGAPSQSAVEHHALEPDLDVALPGEADAAVRLDRVARDLLRAVGDVGLRERRRARRLGRRVVEGVRRVPPEPARRVDVERHVRELVLHRLELRERLAELLARPDVGGGHAHELVRRAEGVGGEQHARARRRGGRRRPSRAARRAAPSKVDAGERPAAVERRLRRDAHAAAGLDQRERAAAAADHEQLRALGLGHERLLAAHAAARELEAPLRRQPAPARPRRAPPSRAPRRPRGAAASSPAAPRCRPARARASRARGRGRAPAPRRGRAPRRRARARAARGRRRRAPRARRGRRRPSRRVPSRAPARPAVRRRRSRAPSAAGTPSRRSRAPSPGAAPVLRRGRSPWGCERSARRRAEQLETVVAHDPLRVGLAERRQLLGEVERLRRRPRRAASRIRTGSARRRSGRRARAGRPRGTASPRRVGARCRADPRGRPTASGWPACAGASRAGAASRSRSRCWRRAASGAGGTRRG